MELHLQPALYFPLVGKGSAGDGARVLYYCAFTPLSTLLEHRLADVQGWNGYLVTFLNMVLNFATEFLFQRFVVYRNSLDTNKFAH